MSDKLYKRPESVQKCPFCGEELSYAQEIDGGFKILTCDCPNGIWFFGNDKMWNFLDGIIAQADKAERLEKENEAMRYEFEVWHGNYECEVEEKKQLQKAVDLAVDTLEYATVYLGNQEPLVDVMAMNLHIDLSKALEQITALTKGDDNE